MAPKKKTKIEEVEIEAVVLPPARDIPVPEFDPSLPESKQRHLR